MLIFSVNTLISLSGVGSGLGTFLISDRISLWSSGECWTEDFHASAFSVLRLQPESGASILFLIFFQIICVCACLSVGHECKHLQSLEKGEACPRVKQVTVRCLRMMLGTKLGSSEETFPSLNQWSISPAPRTFTSNKTSFLSSLLSRTGACHGSLQLMTALMCPCYILWALQSGLASFSGVLICWITSGRSWVNEWKHPQKTFF